MTNPLTREEFIAKLRTGKFAPGTGFQTGYDLRDGLMSGDLFDVSEADPDDFPELDRDERVYIFAPEEEK